VVGVSARQLVHLLTHNRCTIAPGRTVPIVEHQLALVSSYALPHSRTRRAALRFGSRLAVRYADQARETAADVHERIEHPR
jgi:hypothetical protein